MADYHRPNPFEIPLVVELVTKYSSPTAHLPCREVNHLWSDLATRQLTSEGWTLNLNSAKRVYEYLQLIMATQETGAALPPMNIHISTFTSSNTFNNWIDSNNLGALPVVTELDKRMITAASIATMSMGKIQGFFGIQSLSCHLPLSGFNADLRHLFKLISPTVTEITIILNKFRSRSDEQPEASAPADQELEFPRLKSMCLDFTTPEFGDVSLADRRHQAKALQIIAQAAPNLEHIRSTCRQEISPFLLIQHSLNVLEKLRISSHLQQLTVLDTTLREVPFLSFPQEFQFSRLRVLKISSHDSFKSSVPLIFNVRWHELLRVLQLVTDRCPVLESLEITERVVPGRHDVEPSWAVIDFNMPDLRLPQLAHFGCRLKQLSETDGSNHSSDSRASAFCMANLMNRFPNLTAVTTNLEACITLGEVYRNRNEYLMPPAWGDLDDNVPLLQQLTRIARPRLNAVTKLTLDVSYASVDALAFSRHQDVVKLIRAMFPNLDTLIVNLGADRGTLDEKSDLGFVLRLVFGIGTLRRIEVNNYYNGWAFLETSPSTHNTPTNSVDIDIDMEAQSLSLETLVIRGVRRSFASSHIDIDNTTVFSSPRLDLVGLRELIPAAIKPGLVLEIEGDLLMNWGLHSSYNHLLEKVNSMEQPRVRLI